MQNKTVFESYVVDATECVSEYSVFDDDMWRRDALRTVRPTPAGFISLLMSNPDQPVS